MGWKYLVGIGSIFMLIGILRIIDKKVMGILTLTIGLLMLCFGILLKMKR